MRGKGRCKTGLEEEEMKIGRCRVEEQEGEMSFWVSNDFGLGLWMSKSGEMRGRCLDWVKACG